MESAVLFLFSVLVTAKIPRTPDFVPSDAHPPYHDDLITQKPCVIRDTGKNGAKVCVCNSTYCDTIPRPRKVEPPEYIKHTSSKDGLRFLRQKGRFQKRSGRKQMKKIYINHKEKYQKVEGFGGAFTDSTGININLLPVPAQNLLLESYFSENGIEYSLCRVPIGCTDFGTHPYTYDDTDEPDPDLEKFALVKEDYELKIPHMRMAQKLNNDVRFFGSTWTAPRWMKTDGEYFGRNSSIKPKFYRAWAKYFVKFLEKYEREGFPFWAITTQNEPTFATVAPKPIPTVAWNASELGKWIANDLGPTIRQSKYAHTKILTMDDQLNELPWFPEAIMRDNETRIYVDGIATHWYFTNITSPKAILQTHQKFPEMMLLSTEACSGFKHSDGVSLGSWERGENYGSDMIEDSLVYYSGWVDWNMVLNPEGGPTYIDNFVDSPIIVEASSGEFYKQPMFYFVGHFSKFIPRGAVRIGSKHDFDAKLAVVAFSVPNDRNNGGATVVIVLNKSDDGKELELNDDLMGTTVLQIPRRSITTVLYWPLSH